MVPELLPFIPATARSLLHVGCGDGSLGEAIKQRQPCRVIGIETDRVAASPAKRRLDDVYFGDFSHIVSILEEDFDCIVADGVLEHMTEPWSLLTEFRRITSPGGTLVASIPNLANAHVIADLLAGHFDIKKQMRFFTHESIGQLIDLAGWKLETIHPRTEASVDDEPLAARLRAAGLPIHEHLFVTWFIVVARQASV